MSLKKILDYRTIVMGISMLMIVIFHSELPILTNTFIYKNLHIGVDCFLFLSGLGIVQSLNKNNNLKEFYKRRIVRILPTTVSLIILFSYLMLIFNDRFNGEEFYLQITTLNFWLSKGNYPLFMWYIPCIMLYYFISPFIFKFLKNNELNKKFYLKLALIIFLIYLIPAGTEIITVRNIFSRFPAYLLGMVYGMRVLNKEKLNKNELISIIILAIISIIGINYLDTTYRTYLNQFVFLFYIPIVLLITITTTYIFDKFNINSKLITTIGKSTLGIYCSHEFIKLILLSIYSKYNLISIIPYNSYIYSLVFAIIGISFGIIWTKLIEYLTITKKVS